MSRWLHLSYFLVLLLTIIPLFVFVRNHLPSAMEINCAPTKSTDRELKTLLASLRESELKALLANAGSGSTVNVKQPQLKIVALNSTQLPSLSAGGLADAAETGDRGGLHSPSPLHSPLLPSPLMLTTAALTNTSLTHYPHRSPRCTSHSSVSLLMLIRQICQVQAKRLCRPTCLLPIKRFRRCEKR